MIVDYIDEHRLEFGVEPICRVLTKAGAKIAPSTYHARKTRPVSARAARDAVLLPMLLALWIANRKVYGLCGHQTSSTGCSLQTGPMPSG